MIDLNNAKKTALLLAMIALIYFLPGVLSPRDFWVEDESRYAEVVREMSQNHQWLVPHLNGHYYPDKPPLYFWLTGIVSKATGSVTPFSFMVVTWLSTVACILAGYFFGREVFGSRASFIGALLFMSNLLALICAQIVRMDMLMAAFDILALHAFYRGFSRCNTSYYYGYYLFCGLAVLTKGPLGFVFPILPPVVFMLHRRQFTELRRFILHPGWVLFFLPVGGWLAGAWMTGSGDYVHNLFFKQIAGRAVNSFSHKEPIYYYLMILPGLLLPWTGFMPRALSRAVKSNSDGALLYIYWFLAGLVLISLLSGKLFVYLLPLLIPLFWLSGDAVDAALKNKGRFSDRLSLEGGIGIVITFGIFGAIPFIAQAFPVASRFPLWPFAFIFIPLTVYAVYLSMKRRMKGLMGLMIAGAWIFSACAFLYVLPQTNYLLSSRAIGNKIAECLQKGWTVSTYRIQWGILNFYAGAIIPEMDDAEYQTYKPTPKQVLIVEERRLSEPPLSGKEVMIISRYEISYRKYVLITSK